MIGVLIHQPGPTTPQLPRSLHHQGGKPPRFKSRTMSSSAAKPISTSCWDLRIEAVFTGRVLRARGVLPNLHSTERVKDLVARNQARPITNVHKAYAYQRLQTLPAHHPLPLLAPTIDHTHFRRKPRVYCKGSSWQGSLMLGG